MFEVELRGFLSESDYRGLLKQFTEQALEIEEDHRETTFFIIPNATLKVAKLTSKRQAKVALKLGDIAKSASQKELELDLKESEFDTAVQIFKNLGFSKIQDTRQLRHNVVIDDIVLSLKWSADWGYHFEVEKLVLSEADVKSAMASLKSFCQLHGLSPLSDQEFEDFCNRVQVGYEESNNR